MLVSGYTSNNIVIIDLRYIGDCLFLIPLIRNLKANLKEAKISAIVNKGGESLLKLIPEVYEVITVDRKEIKGRLGLLKFIKFLNEIRRKKFDTAIVVPFSDRSTIIAFSSGAKVRIGYRSNSWWRDRLLTHRLNYENKKYIHLIEHNLKILTELNLKIYDKELSLKMPEEEVKKLLAKYPILSKSDKKSIVVHPGARGFLRQWGSENFAKVINAFSNKFRIYLVGGPTEYNLVHEISRKLQKEPDIISVDLSLTEFASLCSLSDLFIGNDSAPIHIAAATGIFVIGLYGPTLPVFCKPWTNKSLLFDVSTLYCRPCKQERCLAPTLKACINEIKPETVIEAMKKLLEQD